MKLLRWFFGWCKKIILSIFEDGAMPPVPTKVHDFRSPGLGHTIYFSVRLDDNRLSVMGHGCNHCNAESVADPRCYVGVKDAILMMRDGEEQTFCVEKIAYARDPRDMFTAELKLLTSSSGFADV